jgi:hypothetical protein
MLFALQIDPEELRVLVAPASDLLFDTRATLEEVEAKTWLEAALRLGGHPTKLQARLRRCEEWLGCSLVEAEASGQVAFSSVWPMSVECCCAEVERLQKVEASLADKNETPSLRLGVDRS